MSEHLTRDYVARYLQRSLSRSERIAADDHLGGCEDCRRLVSESLDLQAAFVAMRTDLTTQAQRGLSHLEYEQLEAYVDGTLSDADCEIVESHAEQCGVCGGELLDLQSFRLTDAAGSSEEEPLVIMASADDTSEISYEVRPPLRRSSGFWWKVRHFWRFPGYLAGATAVAMIVPVVIVFALGMFTSRLHKSSPVNIAQPTSGDGSNSTPPISAGQSTHAYVMAPEKLETPAALNSLIGKTETLMGGAGEQESFLLVKPVGTFVLDVRPEFRWQALAGATEYKVGVFDSDLKAIETSPKLTGTSWKSALPLQRGKIYVWQVTAVKGSQQVVAPVPPAPEAKFAIIEPRILNELLAVESAGLGEHFKLGRAYARAGLLDEAQEEFRLVPAANPNYSQAQRFLTDLKALRHP